jgi:hypothetical protein
MKNSKVISTSTIKVDGKEVIYKKFELKKNKNDNYSYRNSGSSCPNCFSKLKVDSEGHFYCTGDRLIYWESEFISYRNMNEDQRAKYLYGLGNNSRFLELYDYWNYTQSTDGEEIFTCGYTNKLFPLLGNSDVRIPDPLFVKTVESKLGRKLTEEELHEEEVIYFYAGSVYDKFKEGAKILRIPWIIMPKETTVYLPKEKKEEKK